MKKIIFPGFEKEKFLFFLHRHPISYFWIFLFFAVAISVPIIILIVLIDIRTLSLGSLKIINMFFSIYLLSICSLFFQEFVKLNYDILILTTKFLIKTEQKDFLTRNIISISLEEIKSISGRRVGFFGNLLRFGEISIEIKNEILTFQGLPKPVVNGVKIMEEINKIGKDKLQSTIPIKNPLFVSTFSTKPLELIERIEEESSNIKISAPAEIERKISREKRALEERTSKPKSWWQIFLDAIFRS